MDRAEIWTPKTSARQPDLIPKNARARAEKTSAFFLSFFPPKATVGELNLPSTYDGVASDQRGKHCTYRLQCVKRYTGGISNNKKSF